MLSGKFSGNLGSWFLGSVLIITGRVNYHDPGSKYGNQDAVQKIFRESWFLVPGDRVN